MASVQTTAAIAEYDAPFNADATRRADLGEIEELVSELSRASPSGTQDLVAQIQDRLALLRMSPEERALKMPHPNAGRDPRAAGRNPPGPLTPPGVAFPIGVDVRDRSENAERAPIPVAPASPDDVQAWQDSQLNPKGEVRSGVTAPKTDPDAEKKRLADEAAELKRVQEQRQQNPASKLPEPA